LLPFGGAGPLLAAEIAEELGCREVIVPPNPGVISAFGLLAADYFKVSSSTHRMPLEEQSIAVVFHEFTMFRQKAERDFKAMGLDGALSYELTVDMRFVGQAFEIPVELDPARLAGLRASDLANEFSSAHRRIYLHGGEPGRKVEIVGLRFGVRRKLEKLPDFRERSSGTESSGESEVWTNGGSVTARLIRADSLVAGDSITGPAMIEGYSSTLWVAPGWVAERDEPGNIIMRKV
jgi:N-methylhydantoinase A